MLGFLFLLIITSPLVDYINYTLALSRGVGVKFPYKLYLWRWEMGFTIFQFISGIILNLLISLLISLIIYMIWLLA